MTSLELLLFLILIFVSATLAASEIALFSLSRFQQRSLKEQFRSAHRKIKRLLADPSGLLVTILVVNEVVNISLSALIAESVSRIPKEVPLLNRWLAPWVFDAFLGLLITAPVILLACEITPKVIGARMNHLIATLTAGPMNLVYDVAKPLRLGLKKMIRMLTEGKRANPRERRAEEIRDHRGKILNESDFLLMIEEGHKEGAILESELELIQNVFEFDDRTVSEVYTPLSVVHTLSEATTLKQAIQTMRTYKYSRIPITHGSPKRIIGILYAKDLLRAKLDPATSGDSVTSVMRKAFVALPSMRLNALFRKFKQMKTHMAVVQDKNGTTEGIVTMSDVLDALFEDIFPEDDYEDFVRESPLSRHKGGR